MNEDITEILLRNNITYHIENEGIILENSELNLSKTNIKGVLDVSIIKI